MERLLVSMLSFVVLVVVRLRFRETAETVLMLEAVWSSFSWSECAEGASWFLGRRSSVVVVVVVIMWLRNECEGWGKGRAICRWMFFMGWVLFML